MGIHENRNAQEQVLCVGIQMDTRKSCIGVHEKVMTPEDDIHEYWSAWTPNSGFRAIYAVQSMWRNLCSVTYVM